MARAYRLGVARRIVNGIIRRLLRMGWGPARTYLLVTRGRTTGRVYRTPVTLVEQGARRWLVAGSDQTDGPRDGGSRVGARETPPAPRRYGPASCR